MELIMTFSCMCIVYFDPPQPYASPLTPPPTNTPSLPNRPFLCFHVSTFSFNNPVDFTRASLQGQEHLDNVYT